MHADTSILPSHRLEWVCSDHLIPAAPRCNVFDDSLVTSDKVHRYGCHTRSSNICYNHHLFLFISRSPCVALMFRKIRPSCFSPATSCASPPLMAPFQVSIPRMLSPVFASLRVTACGDVLFEPVKHDLYSPLTLGNRPYYSFPVKKMQGEKGEEICQRSPEL